MLDTSHISILYLQLLDYYYYTTIRISIELLGCIFINYSIVMSKILIKMLTIYFNTLEISAFMILCSIINNLNEIKKEIQETFVINPKHLIHIRKIIFFYFYTNGEYLLQYIFSINL